jgi:hypothetical protein
MIKKLTSNSVSSEHREVVLGKELLLRVWHTEGRFQGVTDRTALSGAVFVHPFRVGTAFTVLGPRDATGVTLLFGGFLVFVWAVRLDGRAVVGISLTGRATRLHAVQFHPLGVFLTFRSFVFTGVGPSVARTVLVGYTEIPSVLFGAGADSQSVSSSTDRATWTRAGGEHKTGVLGTFRRVSVGPDLALRSAVEALTSISGAQTTIFSIEGVGVFFGLFFVTIIDVLVAFFQDGAVGTGDLGGGFAFLGFGLTFFALFADNLQFLEFFAAFSIGFGNCQSSGDEDD